MIKAIPEDYHSVTPMFMFKDARKAFEFYKVAFGAQKRFAMPGPSGKGIIVTHTKDLTPQEIQQATEGAYDQISKK